MFVLAQAQGSFNPTNIEPEDRPCFGKIVNQFNTLTCQCDFSPFPIGKSFVDLPTGWGPQDSVQLPYFSG